MRSFITVLIAYMAFCSGLLAEGFLYVGLKEGNWQVHRYDFQSEQSSQLTFTQGDKRIPQYHAATNSIYFKDSQGWIVRMNDTEGEVRVSDRGGIAEFCLIPSVNELVFTCLMANNPQRQVLWHLDLSAESPQATLLKRMPVGSLRQITVQPDRSMVVSHIAKRREERLFRFSESEEGSYISPRKAVSIYPTWDGANQRLLFSKELKDGSYDIFTLDSASGEAAPFFQTDDASEFATTVSPDGTMVLVEQHPRGGASRIVRLNAESLTPELLNLDHPAKEPFWHQEN